MSEYNLKTPKQAEAAVGAYKKIENAVTGTYKKIEDTVVGGYKQIEGKFVDAFLEEAETDAGDGEDRSVGEEA